MNPSVVGMILSGIAKFLRFLKIESGFKKKMFASIHPVFFFFLLTLTRCMPARRCVLESSISLGVKRC